MNFRKKGGSRQSGWITLQILLPPEKKGNIVFRNEGGGSKAAWSFSENSSVFSSTSVPYGRDMSWLSFELAQRLDLRACLLLWNWFGKSVHAFEASNSLYKSYLLPVTSSPSQRRDQNCKWIGPLYNLLFHFIITILVIDHICLLTREVLILNENTHRHAPSGKSKWCIHLESCCHYVELLRIVIWSIGTYQSPSRLLFQ